MIYRNADYRNAGCDNKSTNYFYTCKIFVVLDLQHILGFHFLVEMPWWIMFFCPNWAFNIAKVGSKTMPKSEVWSINFDPYQ
jgi:hypothetical protein